MFWTPKSDTEKENYFNTYRWCLDHGLNFFDTAEVYGNGSVETLLGEFIRTDGRSVKISSKFAPPSRMNPVAPKRKTVRTDSPEAIHEALDGTLERLGIESLDLYLMHTPPKNGNIADYMDEMAKELESGRIKAVGVCNHNSRQIAEAAEALQKHGYSLDAAMVGYNLLRRYPETNGVIDTCQKYNITLIPYAPLAEGSLTGKYRGKKVPFAYLVTSYFGHLNMTKERDDDIPFIKRLFSKPRECDIKRMEPLMFVLENIAKEHGKSIAQVSLNWLLTNPKVNVFPIPGTRNIRQAESNLGAVGWKLNEDDRKRIDEAERSCR
jgi:aryl-alcohol dehydrogenase-like predicted oxidoreductase